jgi:hypothetical protein
MPNWCIWLLAVALGILGSAAIVALVAYMGPALRG